MPTPAPDSDQTYADSAAYLLSRATEQLETTSDHLLRRVATEGLCPQTLLDAGRVLGLAELVHAEALSLAAALVDDLTRSGRPQDG